MTNYYEVENLNCGKNEEIMKIFNLRRSNKKSIFNFGCYIVRYSAWK